MNKLRGRTSLSLRLIQRSYFNERKPTVFFFHLRISSRLPMRLVRRTTLAEAPAIKLLLLLTTLSPSCLIPQQQAICIATSIKIQSMRSLKFRTKGKIKLTIIIQFALNDVSMQMTYFLAVAFWSCSQWSCPR